MRSGRKRLKPTMVWGILPRTGPEKMNENQLSTLKTKKIMTNAHITPSNTATYSNHYNDSAFWRVVKKVSAKVAYPALLLFYTLKSSNVPLKVKAEIIGALGYLILPFDLIPDYIPVVGYTDDFAALQAAVRLTLAYITPEIESAANAKLRDWFGTDYKFLDNAIF